jgi:hypothetical protein
MAAILKDTIIQLLQQEGLPTNQLQSHPLSEDASFYTVPVSRTVALRTWQQLRAQVEQTGFWPLLTEGSGDWLDRLACDLDGGRSAESVVRGRTGSDDTRHPGVRRLEATTNPLRGHDPGARAIWLLHLHCRSGHRNDQQP